jgi:hypothetical protein
MSGGRLEPRKLVGIEIEDRHDVRVVQLAEHRSLGACGRLLDYNWHDCNGLREVVLTAAGKAEPRA